MYTTYLRTFGSVVCSHETRIESSTHSRDTPSMSGRYAPTSSIPSSIAIAVDVTRLSLYALPDQSTGTTATVTGVFGTTKVSNTRMSIVSGSVGDLSRVATGDFTVPLWPTLVNVKAAAYTS